MSISWLLIALAPGGPQNILAENPDLKPGQMEAIRRSYGLDKPFYEQYFTWMGKLFTFDLGNSYFVPIPATEVIGQRIGPTVQLGLVSYLIGMLGIPIGLYAAKHRGKLSDNVIRVLTVLGNAMPAWWLSLMLIIILSSTIKWFPQGEGKGNPGLWFLHLIIPAALLSTGLLVSFTRFVRSQTLDVLNEDYVRTAKAKGLPAREVDRRHVFRNSLIPVVTLLGSFLPVLLGGAIITETIFNWPGLGRLFFDSASSRDMPVLLGILFIGSLATIIGTLLSDIGYGFVDPRVRYQ
jgi:peptide/nickel transport system permease protein